MMPQDTISTGQKIRTVLTLAALMLAIAYAGFILYQNQLEARKRIQPREFLVFSDLPNSTKINATLETRNGSVPLAIEKNTVMLSEEQRSNFYLPFKLSVTLQGEDGTYYDLVFALDRRGIDYTVLLDGFRPKDHIIITMNDAESPGPDYTDWSGRYLAAMNLNLGENMSACLRIETKKPFGFCQAFPVRDGVK